MSYVRLGMRVFVSTVIPVPARVQPAVVGLILERVPARIIRLEYGYVELETEQAFSPREGLPAQKWRVTAPYRNLERVPSDYSTAPEDNIVLGDS